MQVIAKEAKGISYKEICTREWRFGQPRRHFTVFEREVHTCGTLSRLLLVDYVRVDCLVSGIYAPIDVPATTQNVSSYADIIVQSIQFFSF